MPMYVGAHKEVWVLSRKYAQEFAMADGQLIRPEREFMMSRVRLTGVLTVCVTVMCVMFLLTVPCTSSMCSVPHNEGQSERLR